MKPATSCFKKAFTLGAMTVLSAGAVLAAPEVQAATYYDLDFEQTTSGKNLNPFKLDRDEGHRGFSTTGASGTDSIGNIWLADGIQITGYSGNYFSNNYQNRTEITLGLFDSACEIGTNTGSQTNNRGKCQRSISGSTHGDNDLATGISVAHDGTDTHVTYFNQDGSIRSREAKETPDLGNLLIFEENPDNTTPDDTGSGGTFLFDLTQAIKDYSVEEISVVDDANVNIRYYYDDGTYSDEMGDIQGENEVGFFTSAQNKKISQIAVRFKQSGGIGGIRLKEIKERVPTIPEPTAGLGLIVFGAVATRLKRKQQKAEA